jgi:flagellar hook-basal body complex protein FliE
MIALAPAIVSSAASLADIAFDAVNRARIPAEAARVADVSFNQVLDTLTRDAVETLKAGEASAIAGVMGKASVQQVVDSVMSAERSLQTMIAVRDRAVGAYQEISRMAI